MTKKTIRVSLDVDIQKLAGAMRAWRMDHALTQSEAASLIGVTSSWWSCIENGMRAESKRDILPSLRVILAIINLIHEDDSPQAALRYFVFE